VTRFMSGLSAAVLPLTALLMGCATPAARVTAPSAPTAQAVAMAPVTLTAPDGRSVDLYVAAPSRPRGVILFSHGGGSTPLATPKLTAALVNDGFAVLAPLHTDSQSIAAERRTGLQAALATRVSDQKLAADYAAQRFAGLPLGAVGYSYGSLIALMGAGAVPMIPAAIPDVKAVVMFSSPGPIGPLTGAPNAFTAVTTPTLLVTGTADTVPGMVPDPASHLHYFDRLPAGGRMALVVNGATHSFLKGEEAGYDDAIAAMRAFLAAEVLRDAAAEARFRELASTARIEVRRR
jgi:alpha-beta hydrolase superfamily lysophospholipase